MTRLSRLVIFVSLIFWPMSLYRANTLHDFINYTIPVVALFLSIYNPIPLFIIPFIQPKLVLLPFLQTVEKKKVILSICTIFLIFIYWKPFFGQTIFRNDYEAKQILLQETHLYPNVYLPRLFENKFRIYTDKFIKNFFALTDPNNYFFRFHPREIQVDNQNLKKYPAFGIFLFFYGLFYIGKSKYKKFILISLFSCIFLLSILTVFDRNDFLLWVPISMIFIHGTKLFEKNYPKTSKLFFAVFIFSSLIELAQIVLEKK